MFYRYGVYFVPHASDPLRMRASQWLGWDNVFCQKMPCPTGLDAKRWQRLTAKPRIYGFHATLQPPFYLRDMSQFDVLCEIINEVAVRTHVVKTDLILVRDHDFVAFRPRQAEGHGPLRELSSSLVESIRSLREMPSEAEMAKRRSAGLSPRQDDYLCRFGYPYVMDEFFFHMTLSSRLNSSDDEVLPYVQDFLGADSWSTTLTDIALVGSDKFGFFRVIKRFPLLMKTHS